MTIKMLIPLPVASSLAWLPLMLGVARVTNAADDNTSPTPANPPVRVQQRGQFVHDPSTIAKCGSEY